MQFPESWLREFCNPPLDTPALADLLTMAGLEVEETAPGGAAVQRRRRGRDPRGGAAPAGRPAARVPGRRRCAREPLQIVCGAPNARAGLKVPLAMVGAELPPADDGKPFKIGVGKLRGVDSFGMLCSARELKLSDDHGGLLELAADAPVGADIRALPAARRHALHAEADAQPGACAERLRHRARGRSADRRAAEHARHRAGAAEPCGHAAGARRGAGPLRPLLGPHRARRRHAGADAGLDGRPPGALRPALGVGAGRHLELRDVRVRPAVAHLRPRQDRRRADRALGPRRRDAGAAQRQHRRGRRSGRRDRRRARRRVAGRHHGRRRHRGLRQHAQHLRRGRLLVARGGGRALAPLQLQHRRRASLRAWCRPGADGGAHRAHHAR